MFVFVCLKGTSEGYESGTLRCRALSPFLASLILVDFGRKSSLSLKENIASKSSQITRSQF